MTFKIIAITNAIKKQAVCQYIKELRFLPERIIIRMLNAKKTQTLNDYIAHIITSRCIYRFYGIVF